VVARTKRAILSRCARPVIGHTWAKYKLDTGHAPYKKMLEEKEEE
jgi:hypothetical protein